MAESLVDEANALFNFVAKTGNGVKGLVDLGIEEIPKLFIQPSIEGDLKVNQSSENPFASTPIDLSKLGGPAHEKVAEAIAQAAETLGFFQIINHGMDLDDLESIKEAAHRFFAQPAEAKAAYLKEVSPTPLVKYQTSFIPEVEKILEWRDFVSLVYTNDADAEKYWPNVCKKEILQYIKSSDQMVWQLMEVLLKNLGVKLEELRFASFGTKVVFMNYYPPCPNPKITIGAKPHTDAGLLTVLLQDEIGGLFAKVPTDDTQEDGKEEWIEIPPIPGALVINVGDMLQILSNGRYKSAKHKVQTTDKGSRMSMPYFLGPRPSQKIGPLPQVVEHDGGTVYREILFQDYLTHSLSHQKNAIDFAKLSYPN